MPLYTPNAAFSGPINISAFVAQAQGHANLAGPTPRLPNATNNYNLGVNQTRLAPIGNVSENTRAFGLITCAAVIFASTDPHALAAAYVFHANAGHVAVGDITAARVALGAPPWNSILVVVAHPGAHDPGYAASITSMTNLGILPNYIVEIENLPVGQFGINNSGQIGF